MNTSSLACVLLCVGAAAAADTPLPVDSFQLIGPETQVSVVELYTSEGCSSCPPADQWLAQLRAQSGLWSDVVPLAFHVDYWDSLGWHDRFASPAYSARQQRYTQTGSLSQVYTPGVLLQGAEWRHWMSLKGIPAGTRPRVGALRLQLGASGQLSLQWRPSTPMANSVSASVALLGFDLTTPVKRGENAGRELHHDFVVLGSANVAMTRDGDHFLAMLTLPKASNAAPRYALAAWVSAGNNPAPLQAVGGWLPLR